MKAARAVLCEGGDIEGFAFVFRVRVIHFVGERYGGHASVIGKGYEIGIWTGASKESVVVRIGV